MLRYLLLVMVMPHASDDSYIDVINTAPKTEKEVKTLISYGRVGTKDAREDKYNAMQRNIMTISCLSK